MQKDLPANTDALKQGHCVPCEGGIDPLSQIEEDNYLDAIAGWSVNRDAIHMLTREFVFPNFKKTISFINTIAEIAEQEGHHPDFTLHDYKKLTVHLSTHAIHGLSTNDYILAAKISEASESLPK